MYLAIALGACITCAAVMLSLDSGRPTASTGVVSEEVGSAGIGVERAQRLGITPELLAAHGVIASQAVGIINALAAQDWSRTESIATQLASDQSALKLASDKYAKDRDTDARQGIVRLTDAVESGRQSLLTAYSAHRGAALSHLGDGVSESLYRARWRVAAGADAALSVRDMSHFDVQRVVLAQKAEQRAQRLGESTPEWASDVLSSARSDPDVRAARTSLDTHLLAIEAVFRVR